MPWDDWAKENWITAVDGVGRRIAFARRVAGRSVFGYSVLS
jgi:hypothetical protein